MHENYSYICVPNSMLFIQYKQNTYQFKFEEIQEKFVNIKTL